MPITYIIILIIIAIFLLFFLYIEPMLAKKKLKIIMNMVVQDLCNFKEIKEILKRNQYQILKQVFQYGIVKIIKQYGLIEKHLIMFILVLLAQENL